VAVIIDGKKVAEEIHREVSEEVRSFKSTPHLTVILVGEDPASQTYVKNKRKDCEKVGIASETLAYSSDLKQTELIQVIQDLNIDHKVHGILVQLPLPRHIDENAIIQTISPEKDVDGFHPINIGKLFSGASDGFVSCTPAGIVELLIRYHYPPEGKKAVIVGRSSIVGKPLGLLLLRKEDKRGNATVTLCHSRTPDLGEITRSADILVAAVGKPGLIRKDMVKKGVVVIDVGTNRIEDSSCKNGYRFVGDVDFEEVSLVAEAISPVPGGVGPMTRALLLKNTLQAYRQLNGIES
jgi:methylenetetrahydrofolate dehydrogenase (NADP+)/methenyltetrahydrofolate cyclohydrolase